MCTVCNAPEKRNTQAEDTMERDIFWWNGRSWYAVTPVMGTVQMREFLRTTILRNASELAASVATGGTFNIWSVNGDMTYSVVCSADQARLYKDEID
jgi:hypothetical protein